MAAWESAPLVEQPAPAGAPPAAITPASALPNVAPPAAAPAAGLAPREVGFMETTGRTAGASAIPVARTLGLAAATVVGLIGGREARDRVFAATDEVVAGMRKMYEPQPGEEMNLAGQVVGGIAGVPIEVAGGFGAQRGIAKAADVLQRGGTGAEAAVAGGVTGAANVAANLLPVKVGGAVGGAIERRLGGGMLGGAAGGAATGGALGVGGNLGVVAAENASLPEGAQFQDLRAEVSPGVAGGLGAGLGAVAGALGVRGGLRARGAVPEGGEPTGTVEPGAKPSAGAAGAKVTTQRAERAAALPVPIELTKGQRERGFEQQRFERETAKQGEVGRPLRERFADQNERILKNFDEFVDQTGAGELDANAVGKNVTDPIYAKAAKAKEEIRAAYSKAEDAGETAELVPTGGIVDALSSMDSSKANAGVISAAESELVRLGGATRGADGNLIAGEISLADLEEVRKVIGKNGGKDDTNAHFAGELRAAIDAATDGRGGELYQAARKLHRDYAAEFKNQGVIRDLIGLKKGTSDRKVALADVFDRSVLNASLEDLRNVKRTLTTAGDKGAQAWNDLRGKAVDWIKEQAAGNTARDERGNPIVSPAKLDRAVKRLDEDGRLEELFGKQGAQQLRDINDLAKDVYTSPPGAVNTSNTGSLLIHAFDTMATYMVSGLPVPAGAIMRKTIQGLKERKVKAKVRYALGPGEPVKASPVRAFEPGKEPPVPPRGGTPPKTPPAGTPPAAGAAPRGTKRERDLVALRGHATDPQVLKDLDVEIAAERRRAVEARRAAEYRAIAEQTADPDIKAKFTAKADKIAPAPKAPEPEPEPIPVPEVRELTDAEIDPVERVRIEAELETAWRREHRVGDLDAERAKSYARAETLDPEAADRAARQHENSPRAFDREIARIIEEGEARETQGKQDSGGGTGLADGAAAGRGETGRGAQPTGADGAPAPGADGGQAAAPGGQVGHGERIAGLFRDNHGIARSDMPVITNDVKPEFRAELERAGIKVEADRVPASSLKATQRDYNIENIDYLRGKAKGKFDGNPIIVSREGRVVDGHHRWAGAALEGKPIDVLRVDLPIDRLLPLARDFQQRKGIPSRSAADAPVPAYKLKPGEAPGPERERRIQEAVKLAGDALPRAAVDDAVAILRQYKGPPPVDIPPKAKARLAEFIAPLIEKAKSVNGDFSKRVEDLAARLGAEAKTAPVKGAGRAVEKLYLDEVDSGLQAWPDSIGDLVRASIVVPNESQVAEAIKAVGEEFDIVKMKDRFTQPLETGYRDVLVSVRLPNGMRAELQIHVPEMIAAKELGHLLFEVERVAPKGTAEKTALIEAQGRLYGAAYAAAGKRPAGGQPATSSSNLARPISMMSSSDPTMGRPVGTETYSPSTRITGSPSPFSKKRAPDGMGGAFTDSILSGSPSGGGAIATTERGMEVSIRYRLVDVGDLVTSHDDALRVNPAFPAEIQPRDRARDASEGQIARIENGIRPELLADSPKVGDGAPIVGPDAVVESGNARTIALRRAFAGGKAEGYRAWLEQNAARFGLDPKDVAAIKRPMLVRERITDVDRAEFARQANESTVAGMSETEQAAADAQRLPDVEGLTTSDTGEILTSQSAEFIRQFMRYVASPNELNQLMTADGRLSQRGVARIRNAVFARAYGDSSIVAMLTESTEGNVRNLLAGMLRAAPEVAKVRDLLDAGAREGEDFAPALVEAVRRYSLAREAGQKVEQYLAQGSMFEDDATPPRVAELMRALERDARAPTRVADMIRGMVQEIDAAGDPRQGGLFVPAGQRGAIDLGRPRAREPRHLYHTTTPDRVAVIAAEGLQPGRQARFAGVSSTSRVSLATSEQAASYYGGSGDVLLRTRAGFKPTDAQVDLLGGGEGVSYTVGSVPADAIEARVRGDWVPLAQAAAEIASGARLDDQRAASAFKKGDRVLARSGRSGVVMSTDAASGAVTVRVDGFGPMRFLGADLRQEVGRLADDLTAQQRFLQRRATAAGYKDIDEWGAADFDGFMRAAEDWRARNRAAALLGLAGGAGVALAAAGRDDDEL